MMLWFRCNEIIPGVSLAVLFISVCLGLFLASLEFGTVVDVEEACRCAKSLSFDPQCCSELINK